MKRESILKKTCLFSLGFKRGRKMVLTQYVEMLLEV